jgi:hypothetical protein
MIVNMHVDHLVATSPTSANEVWTDTQQHPKLFSDAAARIGMTPKEYKEFRSALLSGKAVYVQLPRRVDAMSGQRHGSVYAVQNAVMTRPEMGWRVDLADGNAVYVPRVCANLSFLHNGAQVAHVRHVPPHKKSRKYVLSAAHVPKEQPIDFGDVPPVPEAPATVANAVPIGGHTFPFLAFLPLGVIPAFFHNTPNTTPTAPPCTNGSNAIGVCSK